MQPGRISHMIVGLKQTVPQRISEWLVSAILATWGLVVFFINDATWAADVYSGLARIGDHRIWGAAALVIGCAKLIALFINGAMRRSPHARACGSFLAMFIWLQLSAAALFADALTVGLAVYPWLFLIEFYNLHRAARDAGLSDFVFRSTREARKDAELAQP